MQTLPETQPVFAPPATPDSGANPNDAAEIADPLQVASMESALRVLEAQATLIEERARHVLAEAHGDDAAQREAQDALSQASFLRRTASGANSELRANPRHMPLKRLLALSGAIQNGCRAAELEKTSLACATIEMLAHQEHAETRHALAAQHPAKASAKTIVSPLVGLPHPLHKADAAPTMATRIEHWVARTQESARTVATQVRAKAASLWSATTEAVSHTASVAVAATQRAYHQTTDYVQRSYRGVVDYVSETTVPYWMEKGEAVADGVAGTIDRVKTVAADAMEDVKRNAIYAARTLDEGRRAVQARIASAWPWGEAAPVTAAAAAPPPPVPAAPEAPSMLERARAQASGLLSKLSGSAQDTASRWFDFSPSTPKITAISGALAHPS